MEGFILAAIALALLILTLLGFVGGRAWRLGAAAEVGRSWIFLLGAALIISSWFAPVAEAEDEVSHKLAAGEIIVSAKEVPGTSLKGRNRNLVDAPSNLSAALKLFNRGFDIVILAHTHRHGLHNMGNGKILANAGAWTSDKSHYLEIQQGLICLKEWY